MSDTLLFGVIVVAFVAFTVIVDFSEFFLDEDSEKILYSKDDSTGEAAVSVEKEEDMAAGSDVAQKDEEVANKKEPLKKDLEREERRKRYEEKRAHPAAKEKSTGSAEAPRASRTSAADEMFGDMDCAAYDIDINALANDLVATVENDAKRVK